MIFIGPTSSLVGSITHTVRLYFGGQRSVRRMKNRTFFISAKIDFPGLNKQGRARQKQRFLRK